MTMEPERTASPVMQLISENDSISAHQGSVYNRGNCDNDAVAPMVAELKCQRAYIESIFVKYRGSLLNYLRCKLSSEEDAAELLQETYLRVLRQDNLDHITANTRAYLYTVATNLITDRYRRNKTHAQDAHSPLEDFDLTSDEPSPEAVLYWEQGITLVKKALLDLPSQCRNIFLMRRFRHMKTEEIASVLGISKRTVERNLAMATSHCKRVMEES